MNSMYSIYHIPGVKIGCTDNVKRRITCQKGINLLNVEILEEHTDIYKASDREIELQKQYGYKVDRIPYWKVVNMGDKNSRSKGGKKGGKQSGKNHIESGFVYKLQKMGRVKGGKSQGNKSYKNKTGMFDTTVRKLAINNAAKTNSIPIIQMDLDGNIIKEWTSAQKCANYYKLDKTAIGNVCKGKYKQHKGYTFKYKE